ncbi:phage portal protein [Butyricicoccus sp.]|uniref:phage portal protein n=1 Tax=Butyricicoccus sp. TaxID=2049021 RepID=UPI003F17D685
MIQKIIDRHLSEEVPRLKKLERYYLGEHDILQRTMSDESKPNNRIVVNYPQIIADSFASYLVGNPIVCGCDDERIGEVLEYNDAADVDLETATDCNVFGKAVNQVYVDTDGMIRFVRVDPKEVILLHDDTAEHNMLYAIRYYPVRDIMTDADIWYVVVYDDATVTTYSTADIHTGLNLVSTSEHFFGDVPFVEFLNNEYRRGSFEAVMSLIDGVEKVSSDTINDWEQFCDCYLILRGMTADNDDIARMKRNRVIELDSDDSGAEYLTKEANPTQVESIRNDLVTNIHKVSCVPDMSDENFASNASGVAIRFKLLGFENATAKKERKFKRGLQRRLELICTVLSITGAAIDWRDVKITFTRNLPTNDLEIAQMVNMLRGIVSNATLLAQLPFVDDPEAEAEKLAEENAAVDYSFAEEPTEDAGDEEQ